MRVPREVYQFEDEIETGLPNLRKSERRGLALWVYGSIMAQSACQTAVIEALATLGGRHALRQRLREWLYNGKDRAAPCSTGLDVEACFEPLLKWVLLLWQGKRLALAIDPTLQKDQMTALVVSVLYRGCAIPVAWRILPAGKPGAWIDPIVGLLAILGAAVPDSMEVIVMADRGLWSPRLWHAIRGQGWHPVMRIQQRTHFAPTGKRLRPAGRFASPGHCWIGEGELRSSARRIKVTLIAVWLEGQQEPWTIVTDLPPSREIASLYALRAWIEVGFRALKSVGWQWQRTRRTDPDRVARYWLILAVATLWTLAHGTRLEDAEILALPPARLRSCRDLPRPLSPRPTSIFRRGLFRLRLLLCRGYFWKQLWLAPEPWPIPPPGLSFTLAS